MRDDVAALVRRSARSRAADWPLDLLLALKGAHPRSASCCRPSTRRPPSGAIVEAIHYAPRCRRPATRWSTSSSSSTPAPPTARPPWPRAGRRPRRRTATTSSPGCPRSRARARRCGARSPPPPATSSSSSTPTCSRSPRRTSPGCSARCSPTPTSQLVKAVYDRPLVEGSTVVQRRRRPGHRARRPTAAQRCSGRSWPASCSRSPASTPRGARCSSGCRSPAATASSSRCSSTPSSCVGLDAIAQVDLGVRRAPPPRRATARADGGGDPAAPRSTGSPGAATCADGRRARRDTHPVRPRRHRLPARDARGRAGSSARRCARSPSTPTRIATLRPTCVRRTACGWSSTRSTSRPCWGWR